MQNALRPWVPFAVLLLLCQIDAGAQGQTSGEASLGIPPPEFVYTANEPGLALKQGKVLRALRIVSTPPTAS